MWQQTIRRIILCSVIFLLTPSAWALAQDEFELEEYEIEERREELEQRQRRIETDYYRAEHGIDGERSAAEQLRQNRALREVNKERDLFEQRYPSADP